MRVCLAQSVDRSLLKEFVSLLQRRLLAEEARQTGTRICSGEREQRLGNLLSSGRRKLGGRDAASKLAFKYLLEGAPGLDEGRIPLELGRKLFERSVRRGIQEEERNL